MAGRNYGPVPVGVFSDGDYISLPWDARGVFLSILAICSYRGRFPRATHVLSREIAAPALGPDAEDRLERVLAKLEECGLIKSWQGERASGKRVHVGQVIGYDELEGLPAERIRKRPATPEWPDDSGSIRNAPEDSGTRRNVPPSIGSVVSAGSEAEHSSAEVVRAHEAPEPEPQLTPEQAAANIRTRAPAGGVHAPQTTTTLDQAGETVMADYSRRSCSTTFGPGKHPMGLFDSRTKGGVSRFRQQLIDYTAQPNVYRTVCAGFWGYFDAKGYDLSSCDVCSVLGEFARESGFDARAHLMRSYAQAKGEA